MARISYAELRPAGLRQVKTSVTATSHNQTVFSVNYTVANNIAMFIDGIKQTEGYTFSNNDTLTFDNGLDLDTIIYIVEVELHGG